MENEWSDWSEEEILTITSLGERSRVYTSTEESTSMDSQSTTRSQSLDDNQSTTPSKDDSQSATTSQSMDDNQSAINSQSLDDDQSTTASKSKDALIINKMISESNKFESCYNDALEKENRDAVREAVGKEKQRRKINRRRTMKDESSSDDDIPLIEYIKQAQKNYMSDSDGDSTYDPKKETQLNSSDSEYEQLLDKESKKKRIEDMKFKKIWKESIEKVTQNSKRSLKSLSIPDHVDNPKSNDMQDILRRSGEKAEIEKQLVEQEMKKVDLILRANNLSRKATTPDGNCFFESSAMQLGMTAITLRDQLCFTLEQNIGEYIAFITNTGHPDDEKGYVSAYLTEIDKLKHDGYWTSNVADLFPLVLANYAKCRVFIYSNNDSQPVITICPTDSTEQVSQYHKDIRLAYTSIPGVLEHYDACIDELGDNMLIATPLAKEFLDNANISCSIQSQQNERRQSPLKEKATPRKRAVFVTPEKKLVTRKRKATPEHWKKNIRKKLRLQGDEYTSANGKVIPARSIKPVNCEKCRLKCETKISNEQRQKIFDSFWKLGSYERQKDFVCGKVDEDNTKTFQDETGKPIPKRKQVSRKFLLEIDGSKHQVCKTFFMNTLSVGKTYIDHALNLKKEGHFAGEDRRGKHVPHNKLKEDQVTFVKRHIESFPKVEGHYVRKETRREFLGPELSLSKMYDLYEEKCQKEQKEPVKASKYRKIFNECFNLSFHIPKKDQCNTCSKYYTSLQKNAVTTEDKNAFNEHQERKIRARQEKNRDKNNAKTQPNLHVCCFDLQSVLYTPCSLVSLMYYMRKLCCYNLSFYSLGNSNGTCFVWTEVEANRGASEIATCLKLYLESLPDEVTHVIFYSDACGGQNRNKIIASCLLDSVIKHRKINIIDHKFLESGHTHMEVDSMHAAVEFAKKKTQIFVPSQWDTVLQMARRRNPYKVVPLRHTDILDFKKFQSTNMKPQKKTDTGLKVMWTKMKWIRYLKSEPDACLFKYSMEEEFQKVKITGKKRQQQSDEGLTRKYQKKIPISAAKKKDLMQLCKSGVIPVEYHEYYKSLPSSNSSKDTLPEPDVMEDTSDDSDDD